MLRGCVEGICWILLGDIVGGWVVPPGKAMTAVGRCAARAASVAGDGGCGESDDAGMAMRNSSENRNISAVEGCNASVATVVSENDAADGRCCRKTMLPENDGRRTMLPECARKRHDMPTSTPMMANLRNAIRRRYAPVSSAWQHVAHSLCRHIARCDLSFYTSIAVRAKAGMA